MYDEATQSKDACPHSSFAFLSFEPEDDEIAVVDCFSSSWPTAKYPSKIPPHSIATTTNNNNNNNNNNSKNNNLKSKKRPVPHTVTRNHQKTTKVRFAPTLEVRTHSIVPGIHPSCEDGLALELGWDYEVSRDIMPRHQQSLEDKTSRWRLIVQKKRTTVPTTTNPYPRLLSFVERKRLLLEVGGFSEAELEKSCYKAKFLLAYDTCTSSSSSRQSPQRSSSAPTNRTHDCSTPMPRVGSVRKSLSLYAAVA